MNFDQVIPTFIAESRELLTEMESTLLAVAAHGADAEQVNALFRAAHTIKGSAGMFGLDAIVGFTHVVESALDQVRAGGLALDGDMANLLLACGDHIADLVGAAEQGVLDDGDLAAQGAPLTRRLQALLDGGQPSEASQDDADLADHWHISLRFGADVLRNGMDPIAFLRFLGTIGSITAIETLADGLPAAAEFDPESCYLGFEIGLRSAASKAEIEAVFDFVREDCRISILAPRTRINDYIALIDALPEDRSRLGEILVRCGSITAHELEQALAVQRSGGAQAAPIGEILVEQGTIRPMVVEAALAKQKQGSEPKSADARLVRVDADKLDHLINLVGELIIAGAGASVAARRARVPELVEAAANLSALVEEVRDSALQLRMVKIGATLNRFQRVVHDVSRDIGKDIRLSVSGEDTELDKTVVEKITDPLTHLVRNALDHGIEAAAERVAAGKPAQGCVSLNAYHDSGNIVIEVSDDGAGLKRERILAKGVERGLVEAGRQLSDREIYNLIFEPGFSTAEQVTNLSGRGVGMDVVKRNIIALRGSVDIASQVGVGTTVTVRLPLTLAIINGFQVGLGKSVFVVPMDMVEECVEFHESIDEAGRDWIDLRGQALPFVRLRQRFDIDGPVPRRQSVVVVRYGSRRAGLVVDSLLGEFQTVIKPLGKVFNRIRFISGSSILGTGDVALILDMPALFKDIENTPANTIPA